jgi:hypothetical protein
VLLGKQEAKIHAFYVMLGKQTADTAISRKLAALWKKMMDISPRCSIFFSH